MLQRVLLAYARWNKQVGYCQGFNVIAALILDVMDRQEDSALKVSVDTVTVSLFTTSAYDWRFGRLSVLAVYSSRRTITRFRARGKKCTARAAGAVSSFDVRRWPVQIGS